MTSAQAARNITLQIYETLYARDENAKPVPELAEDVKISEDGKTYVFPIRQGRQIPQWQGARRQRRRRIAGALPKVGASAPLSERHRQRHGRPAHDEVTITLKDVQSTFLDNLSSPRAPIAIYPAEEAAKPANQINYIGTGPFRFVEYKPDSHVKIARFDGYVPNPECHGPRWPRRQEGSVPRHRDLPVHA